MTESVIRPTMKFIRAGYAAVLLLVIALAGSTLFLGFPVLIAWIAPLLLIWTLKLRKTNTRA